MSVQDDTEAKPRTRGWTPQESRRVRKRSGPAKGTKPNRDYGPIVPPEGLTPAQRRVWLADQSGYLDFLIRMCSGRPIQQRGPTGKKLKEWHYPTLADRRWAAEQIGKKCLPDLGAVQLTGEDGGPISTVNATLHIVERISAAFAQADTNGDRPVAETIGDEGLRAIQAISYLEAKAQAEANGQLPAVPLPATRGAAITVPMSGDPPPRAPTEARTDEATPRGSEAESVKTAPIEEPEPPPVDHTLSFVSCDYTIVGRAPQRPGLPTTFELHKRGGRVNTGPFEMIVAQLRRVVGDDLGEWLHQHID